MTAPHRIEPDRITKPMQLLAAWLVGLIIVDTAFLTASARMSVGSWERGALVVAAIANVPVFLIALFLLQTRFRPELQEDSYYSQYLDRRTNEVVRVSRDEFFEKELIAIRAELRLLAAGSPEVAVPVASPGVSARTLLVGLNKGLDDFVEIRARLKNEGIPLSGFFGTDEPPRYRALAFAPRLSLAEMARFLRLGLDMKFVGYSYIEDEEGIHEDVLIGSYGAVEYEITGELEALLSNSPEPVDLRFYEAQHHFRIRSR
ncbi:hypothetical protein [Roseisolibacter agri]|uniref:Uncharacterized protein n=1 Tax=Roseisolibacter agri TaxID=2014610 RepID=A0AA37V2W9_9BACT|nr:hypothetical protein [Roseisolibacter agri]GLC25782.1 hypothetical protein rosag_22950 [Roseisolibacter agri]